MTVLGGSTQCGDVHLYEIVIDWSMTILKQPLENVIDWSMPFFARIGNGLSQKIVIDQSMTVFRGSTPCGDVHLYIIVIDRSMTILKQPSKNVKMSLTGQ